MDEHDEHPEALFDLPPELVPVTPSGRKRAAHITAAGEVTKAWIAGNQSAGRPVTTTLIKRVGRMAKSLLKDGVDAERLGDVAYRAGSRGYWDLVAQWHRAEVQERPDTGGAALEQVRRQYEADLARLQSRRHSGPTTRALPPGS